MHNLQRDILDEFAQYSRLRPSTIEDYLGVGCWIDTSREIRNFFRKYRPRRSSLTPVEKAQQTRRAKKANREKNSTWLKAVYQDPEKLAKLRERKREWMRKKRAA